MGCVLFIHPHRISGTCFTVSLSEFLTIFVEPTKLNADHVSVQFLVLFSVLKPFFFLLTVSSSRSLSHYALFAHTVSVPLLYMSTFVSDVVFLFEWTCCTEWIWRNGYMFWGRITSSVCFLSARFCIPDASGDWDRLNSFLKSSNVISIELVHHSCTP